MQVSFKCPSCGVVLAADAGDAGSLVDCPKCSNPVEIPKATAAGPTVACRFCGEQILKSAVKCKHCGEFLVQSMRERPGEAAGYQWTSGRIAMVAVAIAAVVILVGIAIWSGGILRVMF